MYKYISVLLKYVFMYELVWVILFFFFKGKINKPNQLNLFLAIFRINLVDFIVCDSTDCINPPIIICRGGSVLYLKTKKKIELI